MISDAIDIFTFNASYNTLVVISGVICIGIGGGIIGALCLLRKRSLVAEAISHATLPGVALAFLAGTALGGTGKNLALLTLGATLTGAIGLICVQWIRDKTRLPEDTAIGTVLSVSFGLGVVLLSYIQTLQNSAQAGLNSFLLGAAASLTSGETYLIAIVSAATIGVALIFVKELRAVAFDENFAAAQGWNIFRLDLLLLGLLLIIISIGLKTVGLVLIVALVIIPPAAARFWTNRLNKMIFFSGLFGGLAGWIGGSLSALYPKMPTGAVIILVAASIFVLSFLIAPNGGMIVWLVRQQRIRIYAQKTRILINLGEGNRPSDGLDRIIARLYGYIREDGTITIFGKLEVKAFYRQQKLWELYKKRYPYEKLCFNPLNGKRIEDIVTTEIITNLEKKIND